MNETKYRFIGGFANPDSDNYEIDAKREAMEETHLEVGDITYLFNCNVDDWRYRREIDKIRTIFFESKRIFGNPIPDDDIEELKWFNKEDLKEEMIVETHQKLFKLFKETSKHWNKEKQSSNTSADQALCLLIPFHFRTS